MFMKIVRLGIIILGIGLGYLFGAFLVSFLPSDFTSNNLESFLKFLFAVLGGVYLSFRINF